MSNSNRRQPASRPQPRPSRAQRQAMEARSAATGAVGDNAPRFDPVVDIDVDVDVDVVEEAPIAVVPSPPPARGALPARRRPRAAVPTYGISRELEYRYIQEDMRRLLIIAGILLALMILLLFVVER